MKQKHKKVKLRLERITFIVVASVIIFIMIYNSTQIKQPDKQAHMNTPPIQEMTKNEIRKPVRGNDGVYRIDDTIIVNKKHGLPKSYNPGVNPEAKAQLKLMLNEMRQHFTIVSEEAVGYRSFQAQAKLYDQYVLENGQEKADTFSARPGFSEHQTGLTFDLIDVHGELLSVNHYPEATKWVKDNAYRFGFIVRYLPEKEAITGYMSEEWHIRYLGIDLAKKVYDSNKSLEEYFNIEGGNYE